MAQITGRTAARIKERRGNWYNMIQGESLSEHIAKEKVKIQTKLKGKKRKKVKKMK